MPRTMCTSWLIILAVITIVVVSPFVIFSFLRWVAEVLWNWIRGRSRALDNTWGTTPTVRQSGSIGGGNTDSERVWDDRHDYDRAEKLRQDGFQNDLNDIQERNNRRDRELEQEQKWQDDDREASRQKDEADRQFHEQQADDNRRFYEEQQQQRQREEEDDRRRNDNW